MILLLNVFFSVVSDNIGDPWLCIFASLFGSEFRRLDKSKPYLFVHLDLQNRFYCRTPVREAWV